MKFGKMIKKAREAANMTQEELGEKIGVTGVSIMRYEKNQRQPKFEQLTAIAEALDVNFAEWLVAALAQTYDPDGKLSLDTAIRQHYDITDSYVVVEVESENDDRVELLLESLAKLNREGFRKASAYIDDLAGNPIYRRTEPPTSEETPEVDTDTTAKEKPPEGKSQPNDGI